MGQISYALLTRAPLSCARKRIPVRLACIRHAANVHPEPGSNSPYSQGLIRSVLTCYSAVNPHLPRCRDKKARELSQIHTHTLAKPTCPVKTDFANAGKSAIQRSTRPSASRRARGQFINRIASRHRVSRLFRGQVAENVLDIHLIDQHRDAGAEGHRQHQSQKTEEETKYDLPQQDQNRRHIHALAGQHRADYLALKERHAVDNDHDP